MDLKSWSAFYQKFNFKLDFKPGLTNFKPTFTKTQINFRLNLALLLHITLYWFSIFQWGFDAI